MTILRAIVAALTLVAVLCPVACDGQQASAIDIYLVTVGDTAFFVDATEERHELLSLSFHYERIELELCEAAGIERPPVNKRGLSTRLASLVRVWAPRAYAHGEESERALPLDLSEDVLAQRRPRRLTTLFPPLGPYCGVRLLLRAPENGADNLSVDNGAATESGAYTLSSSMESNGAVRHISTGATRQLFFEFDPPVFIDEVETKVALVFRRDLTELLADIDLAQDDEALARQLLGRAQSATTLEVR